MKKLILVLLLSVVGISTRGATLTVTTVNNDNTTAGQLSLKQAIQQAQSGDTIAFAILGAGPHVIITPTNGYPIITQNNLTIDGYSQTGAQANTNPILSSNNAVIKIVIDSSTGPDGRMLLDPLGNPGFGDEESTIFAILGGKNFKARGLSFRSRITADSSEDPGIYCFAFLNDATGAHISGCWFGVDPDGVSVHPGRASVAAFRGVGGAAATEMIIGTNGDGVNDRGEFNVHVGMGITIHLETPNVRVSGNLVNVLPDGLTVPERTTVGEFIENGAGANMIIGVNGDGISDDNEANVVGVVNYDTVVEFWRPGATNVIFAGNYVGVNTDRSVTNASNSTLFAIRKQSSVRIGTNGDGVSDNLEANHIFQLTASSFVNWHGSNRDSGGVDAAKLIVRGNEMVDNSFGKVPFDGATPVTYAVYYTNYLAVTTTNFIPTLQINGGYITGIIPERNLTEYPHAFVDIYVGEASGVAADPQRLHTRRLVASISDNAAGDLDAAAHRYAISMSGLGLAGGDRLIAAVTYSKDANRTEVGRAVTSPFSAYGVAAPTPTVPQGGSAPGAYPNTSVLAANWIVGAGADFGSGNVILNLGESSASGWSATRYNRGDFALRLNPANPVAARTNLNLGFVQVDNATSAEAAGQAWSPNNDAGILIPTVRTNGPITWPDGQAGFFGTVAAGGFSSGNGYDMNTGAFGAGGLDVQTGKAGADEEGNVPFSTVWFPYSAGWIGGVIGNSGLGGAGVWNGALAHSPQLSSASIMTWSQAGYGFLQLPGIVPSQGALFTTSADGASHVNIVTASPSSADDGWFITVREDSATDVATLAAADQDEFQFVFFPYAASNAFVSLVDGDNATITAGFTNWVVERVSTGRYLLSAPGMTGSGGVLLLQGADMDAGLVIPDGNFLSYQYNAASGKFEIEARHTTAGGTALEDTDFYVAFVSFANPPQVFTPFAAELRITTITQTENAMTLTWTGGSEKFLVQKSINLNSNDWMNVETTTDRSATVLKDGAQGFFRVIDNYTGPDVIPLTAYLTVDAERSAIVGTPAGNGFATLSIESNKVNWAVTYRGLGSSATLGHIHGFTNTTASAGVRVGFANPSGTNGTIRGSATITDEIRTNILNGLTYVNIHTATNGPGEIRGQILRRKYVATLNGANERPNPVTTSATGTATLNVVGNELTYDVNFTGLGSNAIAAHIHGRADANGSADVLQGFVGVPSATSGTISGRMTTTTATRAAIVDGMAYINLHSAINQGGEIRGQIIAAP